CGIYGRRSPRHPGGSPDAVRRGIEGSKSRQRGGIKAHHPAVIGMSVAVGRPSYVNHALRKSQAGALVCCYRVEHDYGPVTSLARSRKGHSLIDDRRAARALKARGDINGVQSLHGGRTFDRAGYEVHRMRGSINHGSANNADVGKVAKISIAQKVSVRAASLAHFVVVRRTAGAVEAALP